MLDQGVGEASALKTDKVTLEQKLAAEKSTHQADKAAREKEITRIKAINSALEVRGVELKGELRAAKKEIAEKSNYVMELAKLISNAKDKEEQLRAKAGSLGQDNRVLGETLEARKEEEELLQEKYDLVLKERDELKAKLKEQRREKKKRRTTDIKDKSANMSGANVSTSLSAGTNPTKQTVSLEETTGKAAAVTDKREAEVGLNLLGWQCECGGSEGLEGEPNRGADVSSADKGEEDALSARMEVDRGTADDMKALSAGDRTLDARIGGSAAWGLSAGRREVNPGWEEWAKE